MAKQQSTNKNKAEEIVDVKVNKHNDLKVGFAFVLEDCDGPKIQLSDTLTFKKALEPGMINSITTRINNTLANLGQDYFMVLLREYINKKQEELFRQEALMSSLPLIPTQDDDTKVIAATGVNEVIGDFEETKNLNQLPNPDILDVE